MRRATAADLPLIVDLARRHHEVTGETVAFCADSAREYALGIMTSPVGAVWVCGAGSLGAVLVPQMYNRRRLIGVECWFNSFDGGGKRLVDAFEVWARSLGAGECQFSTVARHKPEAMKRLMAMRGYDPATEMWRKEFADVR